MANKIILLITLIIMPVLCSAAGFSEFANEFISADGRVIDRQNGNISHSEGQGYAMLLSVKANNRATFDRIYLWTVKNMQIRHGDSLFAWRYGQNESGDWTITDTNNATDGDVIIAYALLLAGDAWKDKKYVHDAQKIISDIRVKLSAHKNGLTYILPGEYGFNAEGKDALNPSYIILSAYKRFKDADDADFWAKAEHDGNKIINFCTGKYIDMPRDWISVSEDGLSDNKEKGVTFGFDAVRCLLYGSWSKTLADIPGLPPYLNLVKRLHMMPMTVDMSTETMSVYDAPAGFYAVVARAFKETGDLASYKYFKQEADKRILNDKNNYYSYALYLLSEIN